MKKQKTDLSSDLVDEKSELQALGGLIDESKYLSEAKELLGKVGSEVFSSNARFVYESMLRLYKADDPITPGTIRKDVEKRFKGKKVNLEILDRLEVIQSESVGGGKIALYYLRGLKELTIKRASFYQADKFRSALLDGKDFIKAKEELDQGIAEIEAKTEKIKVGMSALESLSTPVKEKACLIGGGLFAPGRYTIFGAQDGEGKTPLMVQLALCAVTATPFLGLFPIKEGVGVLHISGENTRADLNEKWKKELVELEKLKGNEASKYLENLQGVYPDEVDIQLDKKGGTAWLETQLKEYSPDLLILDSLCQVLSTETSLNDDTMARRAGESLNKISRDFDCMTIVTTHLRKPTETESKLLSSPKPGKMYDSIPGGISLLFHGSRYFTNLAVAKVAMYRKDRQKFETVKWLEFKFKTAESPPNLLVERDRETLWCSEIGKDELSKAKLLPKHLVNFIVEKCDGQAVPTILEETGGEFYSCSPKQIRNLIDGALEQGLLEKRKGVLIPLIVKTRGEAKQKREKENLSKKQTP